mgnify:CR=1 FL=1
MNRKQARSRWAEILGHDAEITGHVGPKYPACTRISQYAPDALVVSLGLDTYVGDPISQFALTTEDFSTLGRRLAGLGLPTALVLEGGYAATELGANALQVIHGFEAGR